LVVPLGQPVATLENEDPDLVTDGKIIPDPSVTGAVKESDRSPAILFELSVIVKLTEDVPSI